MTISRSANGSIGIQTGENGFVPVVEPTPPVPPVVPSYFAFGLDNGTDPKLYGSVDLAAFSACGALPVGPPTINKVVSGNGILIATTIEWIDGIHFFSSTNQGASWTEITFFGGLSAFEAIDIGFSNGVFYVLAEHTTGLSVIVSSANSIDWSVSPDLPIFFTDPITGPITVKFFFFKGHPCAITSEANHSFFHQFNSISGTWSQVQIASEGELFTVSDETIAVSDSYILAIRNDNTAWSSPDGTTWTQILSGFGTSLTRVCHIESKFWAFAYGNDGPNLSIPIEDTTLEQGNPIEGFLDSKVQILPIDTIVYGIGQSADYRIWQSPIPPTSPNWTTNSTGIPSTMQLKQLLG